MRKLLFFVSFVLLCGVFATKVNAGCYFPAYCDAAPGTCGATCNGGATCYFGDITCNADTVTDCYCGNPDTLVQTTDTNNTCLNSSTAGLGCGPVGPYGTTNVCICSYNYSCGTCTDVPQAGCCTGGTCGPQPWSECSASCGGGIQTSLNTCTGVTSQQACNTQACGGGGGTCTWNAWSACSATACGTSGTQDRTDNCGGYEIRACTAPSCACDPNLTSTIITPSSGNVTMAADRNVSLSWTSVANAVGYDVQIYPTGTTSGQECTAANTFCITNTNNLSYNFLAPVGVANYTWRVRPVSCEPTVTAAWTTGTFTIVGPLSGRVYLDDAGAAALNLGTGLCELGGTLTAVQPGVSSVTASWTGIAGSPLLSNVTTEGNYNFVGVPNLANIGLVLSPDTTNWRCTCPAGCTYSGQNPPKSDIPFFVSPSAVGWWQTFGGLLYAGNTSGNVLVSRVPGSASLPHLNAQVGAVANTSGITITGGGDIDSTLEISTQYSRLRQDTAQVTAIGSRYSGPREDYTYFYNLYSMGITPSTDFTGTRPELPPLNGRAYFSGSDVTISNPWTTPSGEQMVIFVDGNVTISNTITVENGGFLAIIASGTITIADSVGTATLTSTTPQVEGVFIGNQIIVAGGAVGGDLKFVGAGTFVGWNNVTLERVFATQSDNDLYPSELFLHRPDLVLNTPERMRRPITVWQEVN